MRWQRKIRSEKGAAAVEFALSASVALAMLIGTFQLFMMFYTYHYVSFAAREGSRWALVRGSQCSSDSATMPDCGATQTEIQTYVQSLGFPGINSSAYMTATVTWYSPSASTPTTWTACATVCNAPGDLVSVTVNYAFPVAVPWVRATSYNLSSTSQMVISQ